MPSELKNLDCVLYHSGSVPNRLGLAGYLDAFPRGTPTGKAAEIGVWRGDFSDGFLQRWSGDRLYLIDPWAKLPEDEYEDVRNRDYDPADYDFVRDRMAWAGDRVEFIRKTSAEAAKDFPHECLDFVYIDANHAYRHVYEDLQRWWLRVRPGGILAGHDVFEPSHPGVTAALVEFCLTRGLRADVILGEYTEGHLVQAHSFFIVKPV